eukprot:scaffold37162_cov63-Phaeocystis_antarctica.AAC.2
MAQMVGVLQQLGWLATYSHELFTGLTIEAEGSLTRINQLKGRLGRVTERLARVDDALAAAGESELADICAANPGGEYKLTHEQVSGLFTPNSRPPALQATFEEAKEPPPLYLLDQFVQRDPSGNKYHKYGLEETCLDLYSDPNFFLKQWLDEEEVKRKALKAERKAKKAARGEGATGPKKAKGAKKVKKK